MSAWIALAAVAIPLAALFGPVLVTDRSFAMRDAAHFYYPLFEWCCREWAAGRVPLWNPYENCGLPVLADATSSVFYPGKLLFLLPVDFALRYKLYVIGHVVLAAVGSYAAGAGLEGEPASGGARGDRLCLRRQRRLSILQRRVPRRRGVAALRGAGDRPDATRAKLARGDLLRALFSR